jgi:hypothetical protein
MLCLNCLIAILLFMLITLPFAIPFVLYRIYICYLNNPVYIDTGTETCTEIDYNEYEENINDDVLYANGGVDVETGTVMHTSDDNEESKDLY